MKRLYIASALAVGLFASPASNASPLSAFIATGHCNELHAIEIERAAILADPRYGLGGVVRRLHVNSRQFLDTLAACEWDSSHPGGRQPGPRD
jgi:hypothetical protein